MRRLVSSLRVQNCASCAKFWSRNAGLLASSGQVGEQVEPWIGVLLQGATLILMALACGSLAVFLVKKDQEIKNIADANTQANKAQDARLSKLEDALKALKGEVEPEGVPASPWGEGVPAEFTDDETLPDILIEDVDHPETTLEVDEEESEVSAAGDDPETPGI